jgi:hypothetical protein
MEKIMNSTMTRLIQACCLLALAAGLGTMNWAHGQELDLKPSLPQVMQVDSVNVSDNIVILDGERYRWQSSNARQTEQTAITESSGAGEIRFISQLQRGMRVRVVTDGSAPSDTHAPMILRMERAR